MGYTDVRGKFINNTSFLELNDDEFMYYFKRFLDGDKGTLDILVKSKIKLVYWYIDNYIVCNNEFEYDEIFSVACEALVESFYKYDFNKGIKFSTFLIPCIRNKILKYFRNEKKYNGILSLDEEMYNDSDLTLKDTVVDSNYSFEDDIIDRDYLEYTNNIVKLELDKLDDTDRMIINLYFGFIDNKLYSQSEISRILGLSQSQISKRLSRTLKQIRNKFDEFDVNVEYKIIKKVA